jgi:hypothetical protein
MPAQPRAAGFVNPQGVDMRTPSRLPFPAILAALVLSATPLVAGSTSATLSVGVTVVRSCAVRATSVSQGSARLDLTCASGAASSLRRVLGHRSDDEGKTLQLQVPTNPYRGATETDFEVATVNF